MAKDQWVLGVSSSHNGAACLLKNGKIFSAIQEERLSGVKRDEICVGQTSLAVNYCLKSARISSKQLDLIVYCPQFEIPFKSQIYRDRKTADGVPVLFVEHHLAHAISAYVTSGFDSSAILVADGAGLPYNQLSKSEQKKSHRNNEYSKAVEIISYYNVVNGKLRCLKKYFYRTRNRITNNIMPDFWSLGHMYNIVADQIFGEINEAGKVMGLAPYGKLEFSPEYFLKWDNGPHFTNIIQDEFRKKKKWPYNRRAYENLAASTQNALEMSLLSITGELKSLSRSDNLCYAGGVALNSVANEKIIQAKIFENVHIVPAAEDSGNAIGAAFYGLKKLNREKRYIQSGFKADALGRRYSRNSTELTIKEFPFFKQVAVKDPISYIAKVISKGEVVGWFTGRSELGPRALGQRSILMDPSHKNAKKKLNSLIKFRESFRPFAPVVLSEFAKDWFESENGIYSSPYMLRVCKFKREMIDKVPGVVHCDGTGRVQTLSKDFNSKFHILIKEFYKTTGIPILINTSFNVMGEPIVETPEDAMFAMLGSGISVCYINGLIVRKCKNSKDFLCLVPRLKFDWSDLEESNAKYIDLQLQRKTYYLQINFKYGSKCVEVPKEWLVVLRLIDGRRSGHDISLTLTTKNMLSNDFKLEPFLIKMRRIGLVEFKLP